MGADIYPVSQANARYREFALKLLPTMSDRTNADCSEPELNPNPNPFYPKLGGPSLPPIFVRRPFLLPGLPGIPVLGVLTCV
jgi:hypothetical protein